MCVVRAIACVAWVVSASIAWADGGVVFGRTALAHPAVYESGRARQVLPGANARLLGMGAPGIAADGDAESILWNPASLSLTSGPQLFYSDLPFSSQAIRRNTGLAVALPLDSIVADAPGALGFASHLYGWGGDTPKERTFALGYAAPRYYDVSAGASVRHDRLYLDNVTYVGWALDLGLHMDRQTASGGRWQVGASASDLLFWMSDGRRRVEGPGLSPLSLRIGGTLEQSNASRVSAEVSYAADAIRSAQDRFRLHLGAEHWVLPELLAVRAGYNASPVYDRLPHGIWSWGVSLQVPGGRLDYAYLNGQDGFGRQYESRHALSLSMQWEPIRRFDAGSQHRPVVETPGAPAEGFILPGSQEPESHEHVSVDMQDFSPNGDGVQDEVRFGLRGSQVARTLEITNEEDRIVRFHTWDPSGSEFVWDGLDGATEPLRDGDYAWRLLDASSSPVTVDSGVIRLDTALPTPMLHVPPLALVDTPTPIDVEIVLDADEPVTEWTLVLGDETGQIVSEAGASELPLGVAVDQWTTAMTAGQSYSVQATITDAAGNVGSIEVFVSLADLRSTGAHHTQDGIVIGVPSTVFRLGRSDLRENSLPLIRRLANALDATPTGHLIIRPAQPSPRLLTESRIQTMHAELEFEGADRDKVLLGEASASTALAEAPIEVLWTTSAETVQETISGARATNEWQLPAGNGSGNFRVMLGSFRVMAHARRQVDELAAKGLDARVERVELSTGTWYRVVVGRFADRDAAEQAREVLHERTAIEPLIVSQNTP